MAVQLDVVEPLFAAPRARFSVPGAAALNALPLAEIAAWRAVSPGVARSNQLGWHSEGALFRRPEPGLRTLCGHITDAGRQATRAVAPGFDLAAHAIQGEGWANINVAGAYNAPHDHPGWAWAGAIMWRNPPRTAARG